MNKYAMKRRDPVEPENLDATRHSLIQRLRNWSDSDSWQDFFNTYWRLIYGAARHAGLNDAEAQDVVQETIVGVAKDIKDFEPTPARGSFKAWLLTRTKWRVADQFRKRKPEFQFRSQRATDDLQTATVERVADSASPNLDSVWEAEWQQNLRSLAIEHIRKSVDPGYFQIFDLHVLKECSAKQTAQRLGVSLGQVYFAKYKVARLIQRQLRQFEARMLSGTSAIRRDGSWRL